MHLYKHFSFCLNLRNSNFVTEVKNSVRNTVAADFFEISVIMFHACLDRVKEAVQIQIPLSVL
jgi:hypothetical protein